jgi:hypothetical protein
MPDTEQQTPTPHRSHRSDSQPAPCSASADNPFHVKENTFSELRELLSCRFRQVEIVEPFHLPQHQDGRAAQEESFSKGERGKVGGPGLEIFGKQVNTRFLSNSHTFHCFVREPIELTVHCLTVDSDHMLLAF